MGIAGKLVNGVPSYRIAGQWLTLDEIVSRIGQGVNVKVTRVFELYGI